MKREMERQREGDGERRKERQRDTQEGAHYTTVEK